MFTFIPCREIAAAAHQRTGTGRRRWRGHRCRCGGAGTVRLGAATRVRWPRAHRRNGAVAAAVDGDLEVAVQAVACIVRGTRVGQQTGAGRYVNGGGGHRGRCADGGGGCGRGAMLNAVKMVVTYENMLILNCEA